MMINGRYVFADIYLRAMVKEVESNLNYEVSTSIIRFIMLGKKEVT